MGQEWGGGGEKSAPLCPIITASILIVLFTVVRFVVLKVRQF